jgi:hypothetical protein
VLPAEVNNAALFQCYYIIIDQSNYIDKFLKNKLTTQYDYDDIWTLNFSNETTYEKPDSSLYLFPDINNSNISLNFKFGSQPNETKLTLFDYTDKTKKTEEYFKDIKLQITNSGDLQFFQNDFNVFTSFKNVLKDKTNIPQYDIVTDASAVENVNWLNEYNTKSSVRSLSCENQISASSNDPLNIPYIISPNGKYKLEINRYTRDLMIKVSKQSFSTSELGSNKIYYTSINSGFYLYRLESSTKFGNYLHMDNAANVFQPPQDLSYNDNYIQYPDFYPDFVGDFGVPLEKSEDECRKACNNFDDNGKRCNFYYSYVKNESGKDVKKCILNKNDTANFPKFITKDTINHSQSCKNSSINSSSLYIRNMNTKDFTAANTVNNYSNYENYTVSPTTGGSSENNLGRYKDEIYKSDVYNLYKTFEDKDVSRGSFTPSMFYNYSNKVSDIISGYESFTGFNGIYDEVNLPYSCINKVLTTPQAKNLCLNDINTQMINTVNSNSAEYARLMQAQNQVYNDISGNIQEYGKNQKVLMGNKKYQYDTPDILYGTSSLGYTNKNPSLFDGIEEDTNKMLLRDNNVYFIGSISVVSLLIISIYISSR